MEILPDPSLYGKVVNLVGVSFRTLPVESRELFTRAGEDPSSVLLEVAGGCSLSEVAVLSTCNRFEVISVGQDAEQRIVDFLERQLRRSLHPDEVYRLKNRDAVRHLFRVSASLDSMVVGEAQILGQVKGAYRQAVELGLASRHLHHLFQFSFSLAKRVRSRTGIAESGVSVSYVAVRLAEQIFGSLTDKTVMIIGSGQMAELALLHLKNHGCSQVIVANRTVERAAELALRVGGRAISLDDVSQEIEKADVVIGSISVDRPILDVQRLKGRRGSAPLFLIDLGVPRNFSSVLADLDGVYLYDIDDLSQVADQNRSLREEASREADLLIDYGLLRFERWLVKLTAEPHVLDFRSQVRAICERELSRVLKGEVSPEALSGVVQELTHRISQKVAHDLTSRMAQSAGGQLSAEALLPLIVETYLDPQKKRL